MTQFWLVDAFTNQPFQGNPAAICIVEEFFETEFMQKIAKEFNWSQTAFVKPLQNNEFHIRWFSPLDETPICGHATLAASHILWEQGFVGEDEIIFNSLAGPLKAKKQNSFISLDFPARPVKEVPIPPLLHLALNEIPIEAVYRDELIYVVLVKDPELVETLSPQLSLIAELDCRAISVTSKGREGFDFQSRYFAPKVGIPEDPVCGSSHCRLAVLWSKLLDKNEFKAYQASKRGGVLNVILDQDRVILQSQAVTIFNGILNPTLQNINKKIAA